MAEVCCYNGGGVCKGTPIGYTRENLLVSTRTAVETAKFTSSQDLSNSLTNLHGGVGI
jgi:hypothetical protein